MATRTRNSAPPPPIKLSRIGLIGDVHTERARLAHVLDQLAAMKLDGIVCTGDIVDGPNDVTDAAECCALLQRFKVTTICGNHDRWILDGEMRDLKGAIDAEEAPPEMMDYLSTLPPTVDLDTPLGKVLLCHGTGTDDMHAVQPFDHGLALESNEALQTLLHDGRYRYVISGHTHRSMVRAVGSLTLINAGTLLTGQTPCWSVIDFAKKHIQFYEVAADNTSRPSHEWEL
jgi:predicted phosphodiesterase